MEGNLDKENQVNMSSLKDLQLNSSNCLVEKSPEVTNKDVPVEEGEDFLIPKKPSSASNKEVIIVGNNNTDLQASFKKFREQKIKERQIMKLSQQLDASGTQRSEDFKNALRSRFIEKAKSYLGVPYARRFQDPSTPEASLYLDCCGLIRQCLQDLSTEFGFIIGKWNQAYQMDTLPIIVEDISELKPGDLIFYEGIYSSKRSKPQKHNNVHVEIYLGGESTIGSRYHKGTVSIFPSYKFTSTTWSLVKCHFRSIDTWLNGICKSCCPEHLWQSDSLAYLEAAGKRSIFCYEVEGENSVEGNNGAKVVTVAEEQQDDDVNAENGEFDEDEISDDGGGDERECNDTAVISPKPASSEPVLPVVLPHSASALREETVARAKANSLNDADLLPVPDPLLLANTTSQSLSGLASAGVNDHDSPDVVSSTVGSSKNSSQKNPPRNRRSVSKSLDDETPFPGNNSSSNANGSVKLMVTNSRSVPSDICNADVNSNESSKKVTTKRISQYRTTGATSGQSDSDLEKAKAKGTSSDISSSSSKANNSAPTGGSKSYFVSKSNGWKLVKAALDARGWQQLPFDYQFSSKFGLKWVERRSQIDYRSHIPGQLVCHIPNNDIITTKIGLLTVLRDKFCAKSLPTAQRKAHPPWLPLTFDLESPSDITSLFEYVNSFPVAEREGLIWIYKPSCNNRGRGIRVISGNESLQLICYGKPSKDPEINIDPLKGIIQRYITNPLLIGKEGYKFDIRCYLLISRNSPTTYAFYHSGYCRLALKPYNLSDLDDTLMHLTNASIQKKDPIYQNNKDIQVIVFLFVFEIFFTLLFLRFNQFKELLNRWH
jgi:hypothetical protein